MVVCLPEKTPERHSAKGDASGILWIGRSERIRTSDPLLPKQVRYQAALRSAPWAEVYASPEQALAPFMADNSPSPVILRKIAEGPHGRSSGLRSALMIEVVAQRCQ